VADEKIDNIQLSAVRHSASHIMAQAVKKYFPMPNLLSARPSRTVFIMIFSFPAPSPRTIFPAIEKGMGEITAANLLFTRKEMSKAESQTLVCRSAFQAGID